MFCISAGMVICLERGADLHMAQLMPLPLTVSCFSKIQIGFAFLVPAHTGCPGKRTVKRVCVFCISQSINQSLACNVGVGDEVIQVRRDRSTYPLSRSMSRDACSCNLYVSCNTHTMCTVRLNRRNRFSFTNKSFNTQRNLKKESVNTVIDVTYLISGIYTHLCVFLCRKCDGGILRH